MRTIVAFDFDGTLTRRDTLLEFIKHAKGRRAFLWGFLRFSPLLVLMKLRLYPNWQAKQRLFAYFFRGTRLADFNALCQRFFADKGEALLYADAAPVVRRYVEQGAEVVVISASIENWVAPFAASLGITQVLATRVEVNEEGILTGRFSTANCYGGEKVNRLLARYPNRNTYRLIAFGDSRGDRELLQQADEPHFRYFHK